MIGFDNNTVVQVTLPVSWEDAEASTPDRAELLAGILDWLCEGHQAVDIGRRSLLLSFLARRPNAGMTQRQLAARMELSVARVNRLLRGFKEELARNDPFR